MKIKIVDILVPIIIVTLVLLIIIPVNSSLIDFFLATNISFSLLILLISMFIIEPLQFSIFPSILLISTVFRLALNMSTTRLILTKGNAGHVVEAFGNFVIQGDAVVGFIMFLIIIIVQFLVITKGSERVSEVAARFTLDAMPGKQMAIDADLNSGLINEEQAKQRREKVQRESDFYGAMDGASKFVKGDSIASIIITIINILAGFIIGVMRMGLTIEESLSKFTVLTIGDGLVSQIPALMISVGTGVVVTRAASRSSLAKDLVEQMFNTPTVLGIVGGFLYLLALSPLPKIPLISLGTMFIYLAYTMNTNMKKAIESEEIQMQEDEEAAQDIKKPENILPLLHVDPIELEFGYGIIPLADPNQGGDLFDRLVMIRRQIALEFGIIVPMIRLRDNIQLEPNEYNLKIKGVIVASSKIMFDHLMAMAPSGIETELDGIDTKEPAFNLPAKWIKTSEREKAEMLGYTVVDPSSIISTHLTEIIKNYSYELLSRQDVTQLVNNLKEENETLINELIPSLMSYGDIQKVLANLLRESVSIRDLVTILETLADYAQITRDTNVLTEYVRQALKRQISNVYAPDKFLNIISLSPDLEETFMASIKQGESGTYLAIDPRISEKVINNLAQAIQYVLSEGIQPIIVTAPILRFYFKQMTMASIPDLVVLSFNELESDINVQTIRTVEL